MSKLFEKSIALILAIILLCANMLILGEYTIAYASSNVELNEQESSTNHKNVGFNSYFNGGGHETIFDIGSEEAKLYLHIVVNNAGYVENGTIEFQNTNFNLKDGIENENIQSIDTENNKLVLKQINNGSDITIELPIEIKIEDSVSADYFKKETTTKFTGNYVDGEGKEHSIEKEIVNKLGWRGSAEAELTVEPNTFVPYATNGNYGVMIQTAIKSSVKDSLLPIKTTSIEVTAPMFNNKYPTSVNVIATGTEATNGETDGLNFTSSNYTYDAQTGKVTINTSNSVDNVSWKKDVADEYLVTYLYEGQDEYEAGTNGIDSQVSVNSKLVLYNNEEITINGTANVEVKYTEKEGTVTDFAIDSSADISKGYVYANYDATDKTETEYYTEYTATVNSAKLTTSLEFIQSVDKFLTEEDGEGPTTVGASNYAYNKRIEVNQAAFNKMLGEDGTITVKNSEDTTLGTINKDTTLENGNYVLDISANDNNQLDIVTSAPITEGQLKIRVVKALKGNIDYSKEQMQSFDKMRVELQGKTNTTTYTAWKELLLKEPETKVELEINKKDLTTVVENENVEIRAVLDTSSIYNALFKNPTLKITLPSEIKDITLNSANILLANGLEITSAQVATENGRKVINVELEGNQTEYAIDAEYKGAIIVLNTDITLDTLTPAGAGTIRMAYTNENDVATNPEGTLEQTVNYVAPTGVVAASGISNYKDGAEDILSISDEAKTVEIDSYGSSRTATMNGIVINNYPNNIGNVVVLGRIPSQGNQRIDTTTDLGSTFTIPLSTTVGMSGVDASNYTVYYSDNANATRDLENTSNGWGTDAKTTSKSFLIVFNSDYKMTSGSKFEFSYDIQIPANIEPSSRSYGMYKVYYDNESDIGTMAESKDSAVIGIVTEGGPELSAEISSSIDTVREGQVVKMYATIRNDGSQTATNVRARIPVPEYSQFVDYYAGSQFKPSTDESRTIEVGTLEPGEEEQITYYIRIDDYAFKSGADGATQEEIAESLNFPKEIVHNLEILTNELQNSIPSSDYVMTVDDGSISISVVSQVEETRVLKNGDEMKYTIKFANISGSATVNNTVARIEIPEGMEYVSAIVKNSLPEQEEITDGISYDENSRILTVNLGSIEMVKYIILNTTVTDYTGNLRMLVTATADGIPEQYSNVFENKAEPAQLEISELTSTPRYVKEREDITYKFSVTNTGNSRATNVRITYEIPDGIRDVKATYTYDGTTAVVSRIQDGKLVIEINWLDPGVTTDVEIIATADYLPDRNDKEIRSKILLQSDNMEDIESNEVVNTIEYNQDINHPDTPGTDNPDDPNNPNQPNRYRITGAAWIDSNQNGEREGTEETASGITVYLLNKSNNSIVEDVDTGDRKITETNSSGRYEFSNLEPGQYVVIFVYDSSRYSLTTYQAQGVDTSLNSDAIDINITLDGERRIAAITDTIIITNENARDIDIGMYEANKFDLRLDKYISKVTLSTPTIGTRVDEHNNEKIAQVQVLGNNLGRSTAAVEYKIVITNEGSVAGYARRIVDYLPEEFSFNTELNSDWYLSDNGNIYNSSLENTRINPGESVELTLILSVNITEDKIGIVTNTAEIYEAYNEQGLQDIDSTSANQASDEDDISKAEIVLGLVTGKIIGYTVLVLVVIAILVVGIYQIKKRVLNKKI